MSQANLNFDIPSLKEEIKEVSIELVVVNPYQPRRHFSQQELEELAESIKEVGLIHPPVVRPIDGGKFEIISGERRYRACSLVGMKTIPVLISGRDPYASAKVALIENIQRVDLNPLEIAKAMSRLMQEFGLIQDELALQIGKKRSTVANYLRLLSLPKNIQDALSSSMITMGHAKAILGLKGFERQILLFELIIRDELNVRRAEEAAIRISERLKRKKISYVNRDFFLEQIAEKLQQKLGTKVFIQGRGKRGRLIIDYYNLDDLDKLIALLEGERF